MEACVKGFSFIPSNRADMNLQYIEGGELERTWKTTRRERLKQQEQKIWEDFIQENDILNSVCKDDPYQFLEQLPEACLKELMELELEKMRKEAEKEKQEQENQIEQEEKGEQQGDGDSPRQDDELHHHTVTFEECDKDDVFLLSDLDRDELSGGEADIEPMCETPTSPQTVRENYDEPPSAHRSASLSPARSPDKASIKSSENVTNMIESSIYCAKVKDLRMKINDELVAFMESLVQRDLMGVDPEDVGKLSRRANEFCARYNRIHVYQIRRQIHDIKRNTNLALPFARHTQFQSQMVRVVSLHQNMLQSLQVLHKAVEQTSCSGDSVSLVTSVCSLLREAAAACAAVPAPPRLHAATHLYTDEIESSCDRLEVTAGELASRLSSCITGAHTANSSRSRKSSRTSKATRKPVTWSKVNTKKSDTNARLAMYSIDTLRATIQPKSSSSKDNQTSTGTSKGRGGLTTGKHQDAANTPQPKKKSPRSRRPLMRDPHEGRPRGRRPARDADIRTMVEAVDGCASSHMSQDGSPLQSSVNLQSCLRRISPHGYHSKNSSPKISPKKDLSPKSQLSPKIQTSPKVQTSSKQISPKKRSPRIKQVPVQKRRASPKKGFKAALSTIKSISDPLKTAESSLDNLHPVLNVHYSKREVIHETESPRNYAGDAQESPKNIQKNAAKAGDDRFGRNVKNDGHKFGRNDNTRSVNDSPKRGMVDKGIAINHGKGEDGYKSGSNSGRNEAGRSVDLKDSAHDSGMLRSYKQSPRISPRAAEDVEKIERERAKVLNVVPSGRCEVTRIVRQLCGGDAAIGRNERVYGAKNAQLLCVSGGSPRQPSTPQLLRILEETIQKKVPKRLLHDSEPKAPGRYRLTFNIAERTAERLFQYRTKFVQHMLASPMYANCAVGKPWEMISSVSEQIIDDLLLQCAKEMQLYDVVRELYAEETH